MALAAELAPPLKAVAPAASTDTLMAENTAAAAASAVGNLVRALSERPAAPVAPALRPNGPPVDQILRDLLRPIVKDWLDRELPNLTERLVRAEVRRVISRGA